MDGLQMLAAGETTLDVAGRTYRMTVRRARHYAEAEKLLVNRLPDPLEVVMRRLRELEESERRTLLELAYRQALRPRAVAVADVVAWLATVEGMAFSLWQALREHQPEISWDTAYDLIDAIGVREVRAALDRASGLPLAKPRRVGDANAGKATGQTRRRVKRSPGKRSSAS